MRKLLQIPKDELQVGSWYVGRGINANVGLWDGDCFLVIAECGGPVNGNLRKWENYPCIKKEPYFIPEEGGCFQPFSLIDLGQVERKTDPYGHTTCLLFSNSDEAL